MNELGEIQTQFEALGGWNIEEKAKKILSGLGFSKEDLNKTMNVFSGGWRMRVALASILLQKPDMLFLDEPTNHLDLESTIWLESFLSKWEGGIVMISHDRSFLDRSVNYILEIDLKKITLYNGNYSQYKEEKFQRREQHLNAYENQQKIIKDTERFIERFRYKNTKATQVQSRVKMLEKMEKIESPKEDNRTISLSLPQPSRPPFNIISCCDITKNYGNIKVFNNLDLVIERKQKIGLVGYNGAGKSTLLKMLAGVEQVTSGKIKIGSQVKRAYYAQHQLETLNKDDTVFESIQKASSKWSESEIRTYLGSFMFRGDEIKKYIKVLSGGEKARLAMARMLIKPAHLLLLDEPTNHLDITTRNVVETALKQFTGSIVCISHDRHFLNNVTNLTYEIGKGSIKVFEGNYEYYEWKKQKEIFNNSESDKKKTNNNSKSSFKERKKINNRLSWIGKKFLVLEQEIKEKNRKMLDPKNIDNFDFLHKTAEKITLLENQYFSLIEEKENLESKINQ